MRVFSRSSAGKCRKLRMLRAPRDLGKHTQLSWGKPSAPPRWRGKGSKSSLAIRWWNSTSDLLHVKQQTRGTANPRIELCWPVWGSWGCCNTLPQTWHLKTADKKKKKTSRHKFLLLEARSSKSRCQQGPTPSEGARERESFSAFSSLWWLQRSLARGHLTPVSASGATWPSLCLCLLLHYEDSYHWLPSWLSGKESTCNARDPGSVPRSGRFPWKRKWQPTPVFLPGKSHGKKSLAGYRHGVTK